MKKLEDFKAEKIEIDSIYGGKAITAGTFSCNTQTIGAGLPAGGKDDGSDEHLDV
jgi:hypothetical protein